MIRVALVVGGATVAIALVVLLVLSRRHEATASTTSTASTASTTSAIGSSIGASSPSTPSRAPQAVDRSKFTAPPGQQAKIYDGPRAPYPATFDRYTGREGMAEGELEAFATEAGISIPVALEQRRATMLLDASDDPRLAAQRSELHEATAHAQVDARTRAITDDEAIARTRAAEDAYRRAYEATTGTSVDAALARRGSSATP